MTRPHTLPYCFGRLLLAGSVLERRRLLASPKFARAAAADALARWFSQTQVHGGRYVVDRHTRLVYDPKSDLGNLLYTTGTFERDEIDRSADFIRRAGGGTVIDVGANVGLHSITWAKACPTATVHAFEPTPSVYDAFCTSLRINGLAGRVKPVNAALGDFDGTAEFFETADDAYNSLKDTQRKAVKRRTQVQVLQLDSFVESRGLDGITFIKIDTEGTEDAVLQGAARTIARHRPILFIEIYGGRQSNAAPEATVRRIVDMGYDAYVMRAGELVGFTRHSDAEYNYFFVPAGRQVRARCA